MRPTLEGALVAGADPSGSFSADETRQNLRATMLLGLPGDPAKRPIFLLIDGFNRVIIGGNRYRRVYEMPNIGLWDLDVHQVIVEAIDES
jgi:hypothetical protein